MKATAADLISGSCVNRQAEKTFFLFLEPVIGAINKRRFNTRHHAETGA